MFLYSFTISIIEIVKEYIALLFPIVYTKINNNVNYGVLK